MMTRVPVLLVPEEVHPVPVAAGGDEHHGHEGRERRPGAQHEDAPVQRLAAPIAVVVKPVSPLVATAHPQS